ncbi:uncharacterized protein BT62DRAFT_614132 [Guyanagaster necrorhizus]|uniref:Uncharacterized protein n=1 Tax=Guyanagaster necrorhizus TaxID=856835 RepID=A0A9P8AXF9_9AGAR|nr:uncharacterized protein BT62DRAFT_614132 [Guyanagaster necrorhizus MCA 3950]KAG7449902.1 hypothetical protein BT62DRAFT_614132 [Guyanagaster necrorhizus MCA 3950]
MATSSSSSEEDRPEIFRVSSFSPTPGKEEGCLPSPTVERPGTPLFPADAGLQGWRSLSHSTVTRLSPLSSPGGSTESYVSAEGMAEISRLFSGSPKRSMSTRSSTSSPLNPANMQSVAQQSALSLSESNEIPPEDIRAICHLPNTLLRDSTIAYRFAGDAPLTRRFPRHRDSVLSLYGVPVLASDSRYPFAAAGVRDCGLVAYTFDPLAADLVVDDDDESLRGAKTDGLTPCGVVNVAMLALTMIALISLFVVYPVVSFFKDNTIPTSRLGARSKILFFFVSSKDVTLGWDTVNKPGEYSLTFKAEFDEDNRPLVNGNDPVRFTTVFSKSFIARIFKNLLVFDGSAGAVHLHRPVCIKTGGYVEISYRSVGDREIKRFAVSSLLLILSTVVNTPISGIPNLRLLHGWI